MSRQVNYNGFEPEKKKKPEITEATIDPSEIGLVAWLPLTPGPIVFCWVYWGYQPEGKREFRGIAASAIGYGSLVDSTFSALGI